MENTDHVNRYFILRIPFLPLLALLYLIRWLSLSRTTRKYLNGRIEMDESMRYERFLSLNRLRLLLEPSPLSFVWNRRNVHSQAVFVVKGILDGSSIPLMAQIARNEKNSFPRFLLSRAPSKSIHWELIGTFYGENDLERALSSRRPLLMEKSFLEGHPRVMESLLAHYLPIVPILHLREGRRSWYALGEQIRTFDFVSFRGKALLEAMEKAYGALEKELRVAMAKGVPFGI